MVTLAGAVLIVAVRWNAPSAPLKQELCPKFCTCLPRQKDRILAVDVQCGAQNLTKVPQIIQNDIPLSTLNLSHNNFTDLQLSGYQSAKSLYLHHCKLKSIDKKAFYGFKNLTVVDLSYNLLFSIPADIFSDNDKLENLTLQNNLLYGTETDTPFLTGPRSLVSLNLQSCKLSTISSTTFSLLPNLRLLDISRNKLVSLKSESLYILPKLEDVYVDGNNWKCGPEFEDLLCWMHRKIVTFHDRTSECKHDNGTLETWNTEKRASLCCNSATLSLTQYYGPDVSVTTSANEKLSCPQEGANNSPLLLGFIVCIFCLCLVIYTGWRVRGYTLTKQEPLLHGIKSQCAEVQNAERGPTGNVMRSQNEEEGEENLLNSDTHSQIYR
jgi:hypothetical protein